MLNLDAKDYLLIALACFALFYIVRLAAAAGAELWLWRIGTGYVTNFFDTLGIGSFATTTAIFRWRKMVKDEQIPGTLNVGHTLPTVVQAYIFTILTAVYIGGAAHPEH